jgi:PAS domain S-box-containing protein
MTVINHPKKLKRALKDAEASTNHLPNKPVVLSANDKLLDELQAHQIKLEMQGKELQRTHAELQNAKQRYADLYEFSPVSYLTVSHEGVIIAANLSGAELLCEARQKLLGRLFSHYISREDRDSLHLRIMLAFKTGESLHCGLKIQRADNSISHVLLESKSNEVDNKTSLLITLTDFTERKRAEEATQTALQYSRSLIEASLDPLVTISAEGKITDVNTATEKVTGVERISLVGSDFANYFTDPEEARNGYEQVFSRGYVTDYPLAIRHVSGKVTDVLYNASVYKDLEGNVLGVFAAARDVTERKRAEEATQTASQYSRSLIEASLDPLVTISAEGKITDVNTATEKVTGVERVSLVGSDFANYFTDPEEARNGYEQVFSQGYVTDYPLAIRHVSGKVTDVLYNASVYYNAKGEVAGVFAAARDAELALTATIFESQEGMFITDANAVIRRINKAFTEITSYTSEDAIGHKFEMLSPDFHDKAFYAKK